MTEECASRTTRASTPSLGSNEQRCPLAHHGASMEKTFAYPQANRHGPEKREVNALAQ